MTSDAINVILSIVGTALLVGGIVWGLERRKERTDITNLGKKVDQTEKDHGAKIAAIEVQVASILSQMNADRVATITAINDSRKELTDEIHALGLQVASLTSLCKTANELRSILREERNTP